MFMEKEAILTGMSVETGSIVEGTVNGIAGFGVFVQLPDESVGMVHISEVAESFVKDINEHLKVGDKVKVKVLAREGDKISLSIRKALPPKPQPVREFTPRQEVSFEEMMSKFMKDSQERQTDIKRNARNHRGGYSRGK